MATFQNLSDRLDAIEKFIGGGYVDADKSAYVEELHTKFLSPEDRKKWAETSADRIKERDAAKANAPKVAPVNQNPPQASMNPNRIADGATTFTPGTARSDWQTPPKRGGQSVTSVSK
jgi:hypothetical protein